MIKFENDLKNKNSGFNFSICSLTKLRAVVICGVFKRPYYNFKRGRLCLGYIYINSSFILERLKHLIERV